MVWKMCNRRFVLPYTPTSQIDPVQLFGQLVKFDGNRGYIHTRMRNHEHTHAEPNERAYTLTHSHTGVGLQFGA